MCWSVILKSDFYKLPLILNALLHVDLIGAVYHDQTLRSSVDGTSMLPRSRTSLYDKSFLVSAPKYWNSFKTNIHNGPSISSF